MRLLCYGRLMNNHDQPFSRRFGHRPAAREITVRKDAPQALREGIVMLADSLGLDPRNARLEVCGILLRRPDPSNWSAYPNVFTEVQMLVENDAPWYRVFDIAEGFHSRIAGDDPDKGRQFEERLNELFVEQGIGWAMEKGRIVVRGSEAFSLATKEAAEAMEASGRKTAATELREAIQDISRRPKADETGAIQHAMAALECVARDVTGRTGKTLGALIPELDLPKPLDTALEKMWGYASEVGRHLREGREPTFDEAELVVTIACGVSTYLSRRAKT